MQHRLLYSCFAVLFFLIAMTATAAMPGALFATLTCRLLRLRGLLILLLLLLLLLLLRLLRRLWLILLVLLLGLLGRACLHLHRLLLLLGLFVRAVMMRTAIFSVLTVTRFGGFIVLLIVFHIYLHYDLSK